jgi:predicted AlkP superfamily phosphohydrolase/phosphomutase
MYQFVQQKPQSVPTPVIHQESPQELKQLSIFDLFENAGEPVMVLAPPKNYNNQKAKHQKKKSQ